MNAAPLESRSDAARLRQRGLRVTGPRLAILSTLEQQGGHRSADELVLALRRGGYHHARTTVYNALDDLARAGLVLPAPVDSGALRYEVAGPAHHHFVCRGCGLIRNVPITEETAVPPVPPIPGSEVTTVDVVYRGWCSACAEAQRTKQGPGEREQDREDDEGRDPGPAVSGPAPDPTMSRLDGPPVSSILDLAGVFGPSR
jgi:Fe2+ or Zn2+ uptake regulation protein